MHERKLKIFQKITASTRFVLPVYPFISFYVVHKYRMHCIWKKKKKLYDVFVFFGTYKFYSIFNGWVNIVLYLFHR